MLTFEDKHLKRFSRACTGRSFSKGDYILRQGDDGTELDIATHGIGDILGEMSVIDGAERTAYLVLEMRVEYASW